MYIKYYLSATISLKSCHLNALQKQKFLYAQCIYPCPRPQFEEFHKNIRRVHIVSLLFAARWTRITSTAISIGKSRPISSHLITVSLWDGVYEDASDLISNTIQLMKQTAVKIIFTGHTELLQSLLEGNILKIAE
jgi:hypothetical protein